MAGTISFKVFIVEVEKLEENVNKWLEKEKVKKILSREIVFKGSGGFCILTIFYLR